MTPLEGVWAASITPLSSDLTVDVERLQRHIEWLLENGCHGVVLFGTTGEGNSFSTDERQTVLDGLAGANAPMDRLLVGTGTCAEPDTIALSKQAAELGCAGVLLLPPFYYKNVSDDGLYRAMSRVIDGVGNGVDAGDQRIVLYHFPRMAGLGYSVPLIQRLKEAYPDIIAGVKDSSGDTDHLTRLCKDIDDFAVFAGSEALLPYALNEGGVGCISATANVTSRIARRVFDGENELGEPMIRTRKALESLPFVSSIKHLLAEHFDEPEMRTVRPPLMPLGEKQLTALSQVLGSLTPLPNFEEETDDEE